MNSNISEPNAEGRILRVKHGYNPNSSSMGSMVFILPASLLAATVGFGTVSGIIMSAFMKNPEEAAKDTEQIQTDSRGESSL